MDIYIIIYTLLALTFALEFKDNKRLKYFLLKCWCVFFAIFGGLRWGTGGDFEQGVAIFNYVTWSDAFHFTEPGSSTAVEPLYSFLHLVVKNTFGKYHFMMLLICSFLQFSYYHFCKKFSPDHPLLAYALLIIGVRSMFPVRSGFALAFIYWAYIQLSKNNIRGFILFGLLALGIHNMSLMLIPIYILYLVNYSIKFWQAIGVFILLLITGKIFQDYFTVLAFLVGGDIGSKVQAYTEFETEESSGGFGIITVLTNIFYLFVFFYIRKVHNLQNDKWYNLLLQASVLTISIKTVFMDGMADLVRLIDPIVPCLIILQVKALNKYWKDKSFYLICRFLFILVIFKTLSAVISSKAFCEDSIPYTTIFDNNISFF